MTRPCHSCHDKPVRIQRRQFDALTRAADRGRAAQADLAIALLTIEQLRQHITRLEAAIATTAEGPP